MEMDSLKLLKAGSNFYHANFQCFKNVMSIYFLVQILLAACRRLSIMLACGDSLDWKYSNFAAQLFHQTN